MSRDEDYARGIAKEKTRESVGSLLVFVVMGLAWWAGEAIHGMVGLGVMIGGFWWVYRYYSGAGRKD